MEQMKTIEINGVKMEVDLRHAKRVDELRVGDRVKVLKKDYSEYKVNNGVIIGFEPFSKLPTIIVAHIEVGYSDAKILFTHYNEQSKDVEVVKAIDDDHHALDKTHILKQIDRQIEVKQQEINDYQAKKEYFLDKFKTYWEPVELNEEKLAK